MRPIGRRKTEKESNCSCIRISEVHDALDKTWLSPAALRDAVGSLVVLSHKEKKEAFRILGPDRLSFHIAGKQRYFMSFSVYKKV